MSHLEPQDRLGSGGVERREELLVQLRPIVRRRGWRRVGVRVGSLAVVIAAVAGAVSMMWRAPSTVAPMPPVFAIAEPSARASIDVAVARPAEPSLRIEVVTTVPGIAQRLSRVGQGVRAASDEELIAALRASGQDPGIVRVDGQVVNVGGVWAELPAN